MPGMPRPGEKSIYFIQGMLGGPIKIGFARDPFERLRNIQVSHHDELVLLGVMRGRQEQETRLHRLFALDRIRGEWFKPSPELYRFIEQNCDEISLWTQIEVGILDEAVA